MSTRLIAAAMAAVALAANVAPAQDYPAKPIRILTAAAGGSSDLVARIIAQGYTENMGQAVIVDNRTSLLASENVAKSAPDGYTLIVSSESLWIRPLMDKVPYDPRDFAPITQLTREVYVVAVHPSVPAKSMRELVALAKAKPAALNYGSGPKGAATHLAAELFASMTKTHIVQIPYKGTAQSVTALIAGEVQLMFANPSMVAPHAKLGKLRMLAVTAAQPTQLAPGLPTVAAAGVPGYESVSIQGLLAPAKTPSAIINKLHQESLRVLNAAGVKDKMLNVGSESVGSSPEQFAAFVASDTARMGKVIKESGIRAD